MIVYQNREQENQGKKIEWWNEYHIEGNKVSMYRCHWRNAQDGNEGNPEIEEEFVESWQTDDPNMPEWLNQYI